MITDYQVEFPRYQRNKAWTSEDKFKLFVSVFKSYPIGAIVVKELVEGEKLWILDGRQRYEAIRDMQNPENVYVWSRDYCKFKDGMSSEEVRDILREEISLYLGHDIVDANEPWFTDLSEIVCTVHPLKKRKGSDAKTSGFRDPFIYKKFKPNYVIDLGKHLDVKSDKLLDWVLGSSLAKSSNIDDLTAKDVLEKYDVKESEKEQVLEEINTNLYRIKKALKAVKILQTAMQKNQLSLITLDKDCKSSDEMKIFEIVNTGGKLLSNAQVRSAKKQWNYEVEDLVDGDKILEFRSKLYNAQELTLTNTCVSWDFAATFVDRLSKESDVLLSRKFREMEYGDKASMDKMEFGFKLLCARFRKSVTKEQIDLLPEKDTPWSSNCVEYANEINDLSKFLIANDRIFQHLYDYGFSVFSLGQNIAICFLNMAIERWNYYGKPTSGQKYRSFLMDIRVLLDTYIYEYIMDQWKGSGDSRLQSNLAAGFNVTKISDDEWNELIDGLYENNEMRAKWSKGKLDVLTYYFTAVRHVKIHVDNGVAHVDHIIPASQFLDGTEEQFKKFKDSLINYALLPPKLNKEKSDWTTQMSQSEIDDVCEYENLDREHLDDILVATGIPRLKEIRSKVPIEVKDRRKEYVNCEGYWKID